MFTVSQAALRLGVCPKTIRRWNNNSILGCIRTPGNHRRITPAELDGLLIIYRDLPSRPTIKKGAVYARVSGYRQTTDGDLDRQFRQLLKTSVAKFKRKTLVFTDIGSGLNMRRRGLKKLLKAAKARVNTSVVESHSLALKYLYNITNNLFNDLFINGVL